MKTKIQQKYDAFVSYFEEHMPVAETELEYKCAVRSLRTVSS